MLHFFLKKNINAFATHIFLLQTSNYLSRNSFKFEKNKIQILSRLICRRARSWKGKVQIHLRRSGHHFHRIGWLRWDEFWKRIVGFICNVNYFKKNHQQHLLWERIIIICNGILCNFLIVIIVIYRFYIQSNIEIVWHYYYCYKFIFIYNFSINKRFITYKLCKIFNKKMYLKWFDVLFHATLCTIFLF